MADNSYEMREIMYALQKMERTLARILGALEKIAGAEYDDAEADT